MNRRPIRSAAIGLLLVLLCVACSGSDVETGKIKGRVGGNPEAGARPIRVEATNFKFSPDTLRVKAGEEIALRLHSEDSSHNLAIDGLGVVAEVGGGETTTARLRIDAPGTYTYFCTIPGHRDGGMEGTIMIQ